MASFDTNKPGSGNWPAAGANAGRTIAHPPGRANMAIESTPTCDASVSRSDKASTVASNIDSPILPRNVALDFVLLMYNALNLPLQFPGNLTGPMSPFGLFTQFGLPAPPLPMIPQTSMTAMAPDNAVPNRRQMPAVDFAIPSAMPNAHIMGQTARLGQTVSRPEFALHKQVGRQASVKAGSSMPLNARSIPFKRSANGFSPAINSYPIAPLQASAMPHRSSGSRAVNTERPATAGSGAGVKINTVDTVSKVPTLNTGAMAVVTRCDRPSSKVRPGAMPATGNSRTVGSYAAKSTPAQNYRDDEAVALLLELRNGCDLKKTPTNLAIGRSDIMTSSTAARTRINSRQGVVEQKRSGSSVYSHAALEQAVDLSTKPKLKSQDVRGTSHSQTLNNNAFSKSRPNSSEWPMTTQARAKTSQYAVNGPNGSIRRRPTNDQLAQQPVAASRAGHANLQTPRPLLSPKRAKVDSTSVVSHLPSCICAFDRPSNIEGGGNAASQGQDLALHGQSNLPHSLHFKKAMCEKFSQAPCSTSVVYQDTTCQSGHVNCCNRNAVLSYADAVESSQRTAKAPSLWSETQTSASKSSPAVLDRCSLLCTDNGNLVAPAIPSTKVTNASSISERIPSISKTGLNSRNAHGSRQSKHSQSSEKISKEFSASTTYAAITDASATIAVSTARQSIPSFSELRQKSVELHCAATRDVACGNRTGVRTSGFKPKLPTSNLYRIRNSALGGSNDSLHSTRSDEDAVKANIDDESDSRCSSSDSETSNSDDSECESDQETPKTSDSFSNQAATNSTSGSLVASPVRSRFVLSRPKFTLTSSEAGPSVSSTSLTSPAQNPSSKAGIVSSSSPSSKVKMKSPTFTFSSSGTSVVGGEAEIPELTCDAGEGQDSFKYQLIQALAKPGSKDGVAVNGKSLRELVGEADYFYHNNRKYILKRVLKPAKDSVSEGASVRKSLPPAKKNKKGSNDSGDFCDHISQPKIEPRISVTARKLPEKEDDKPAVKKAKRIKKHHRRLHRGSSDDRKKSSSSAGAKRRVNTDTKAAEHSVPHNKRRRRNHEIDNLIFEGAGGLTPMPDLSLRDNDVFSNIKLRRRKAAQFGIAEVSPTVDKLTRKYTLKTIKKQAHHRAIANKNRKRSIEKRLRKYQVKNRLQLVKKDQEALEITPRTSCVRINAGVARPYTVVPSFVADEDQKSRKNPITGPCAGRQNDDGDICSVTPQGKQTLGEQARYSFTSHGATAEHNSRPNCASSKSTANINVDESFRLENVDQTAYKVDRVSDGTTQDVAELERYRRTSKRLFEQKRSEDKRTELTQNDDETTTCDSDSVRSDSPFLPPTLGQQHRRKRKAMTMTKAGRQAAKSTKNSRSDDSQSKQGNISLVSLFSTPPALTLAAAFGDLQPSYSMKAKGKRGTPAVSAWQVGSSAVDTKHQLQRELWRSMTLDMFTNKIK